MIERRNHLIKSGEENKKRFLLIERRNHLIKSGEENKKRFLFPPHPFERNNANDLPLTKVMLSRENGHIESWKGLERQESN